MLLEIIEGNITDINVDAIVTMTTSTPSIGRGIDDVLYRKLGRELWAERVKIGVIDDGDAAITSGFDLNAKYIIHAVEPNWENCDYYDYCYKIFSYYNKIVYLAKKNNCSSIAISSNCLRNKFFSKVDGLLLVIGELSEIISRYDLNIHIVTEGDGKDKDKVKLTDDLLKSIDIYLEKNYVKSETDFENGSSVYLDKEKLQSDFLNPLKFFTCYSFMSPWSSTSEIRKNLEEAINNLPREGFERKKLHDMVEAKIGEKKKKKGEFLGSVGITRQHYNNIIEKTRGNITKKFLLRCVYLLELNVNDAEKLLNYFGFAFSECDTFDVIVKLCIAEGLSIYETDEFLEEHGCDTFIGK